MSRIVLAASLAAILFAPSPFAAPAPQTPQAQPSACHIKITKHTNVPGTGFGFTSAWSGLQGITLNSGQSIVKPVGCGPIFNVYETPMVGWTLVNITCTVSGGTGNFRFEPSGNSAFQPGDNEVNFDSLSPGAKLHCVFKNHKP